MASPSNAVRICMLACRLAPRVQRLPRAQRLARRRTVALRTFSTSLGRQADTNQEGEVKAGDNRIDTVTKPLPDSAAPQRPDELDELDEVKAGDNRIDTVTKPLPDSAAPQRPDELDELDEFDTTGGYNMIDGFLNSIPRSELSEQRELDEAVRKIEQGEKPNQNSFWYDEDDPDTNTEEQDEFQEDEITSMAHAKLDEVREMRHYERLAVWEMPLLSRFAKPFTPPTDDQVLRWRYTTYMGESHPAEKKVVVQFAPDDLKLTPTQTDKLKKLAGPRYNPETEFVKMSSESFEHQAQNKRYLSDMVDDLIAAAKDPTDTFEDVPLDLRHHQSKTKPRFPQEWRLTDKRLLQLGEHRQRVAMAESKKSEEGLLVHGEKMIGDYLTHHAATEEKNRRLAEAQMAASRVPSSNDRRASRARR